MLPNPHLAFARRPCDAKRRLIVGAGGERRADHRLVSRAIVVVDPRGISRCGRSDPPHPSRRRLACSASRRSGDPRSTPPCGQRRAPARDRRSAVRSSSAARCHRCSPARRRRTNAAAAPLTRMKMRQADVFRGRETEDVLPEHQPVVDVEQCQDDRERDGELVTEERRKEDRQTNTPAGSSRPQSLARSNAIVTTITLEAAIARDRRTRQTGNRPHMASVYSASVTPEWLPPCRCARAGRGRGVPPDELSNPAPTLCALIWYRRAGAGCTSDGLRTPPHIRRRGSSIGTPRPNRTR